MKKIQGLWQAGMDVWQAIIAFISGVVGAFGFVDKFFQWGIIKTDWIFPIFTVVFYVFGAIAIIRANREVRNFKNTLPNIKALSIPRHPTDKYLDGMHRDAVGVEFINNPKTAASNCVAKKVYATIDWIDAKKNTEEINQGRWWYATGDNLSPSLKQTVDISPNGQSKLLQFAIKDPDEDILKAWYRDRDGNDIEVKLSQKEYTVVITLKDDQKLSWSFKYKLKFLNGRWEIKKG